ncbi:HD domain-containing protein [Celeribacter sp.]|uniref:HD domain-containing protein n=1 Tax=Celeribacter sp. TaxID=1890673 RepID=UPI003A8E3D6F
MSQSDLATPDVMTANLTAPDIEHCLSFLIEADALKSVLRANQLMDRTRFENSAEHSWHAALAALIYAPLAGADVDIARAIEMLIVHDLVEIDAGDHPIHISHDPASVRALEDAAADRLFGLLPAEIGTRLRSTWEAFEAMDSPTALYAKSIDFLTPALQSIGAPEQLDEERAIVEANLRQGRASRIAPNLPALFEFTLASFEGRATDPVMQARFDFWCEADRLKTVLRATPIMDGSRPENSGEHSWHVALWALTFAPLAEKNVDIARVISMLLLHDIVEVDAGDHPIHGHVTPEALAAQDAAEQAAADRLFGLLPEGEGAALRAIWEEFEAAETPAAIFGKSIDRAQPVLHNLVNDGGSWRVYSVTLAQIDTRVGVKVARGAPALWPVIRERITPWFAANALAD